MKQARARAAKLTAKRIMRGSHIIDDDNEEVESEESMGSEESESNESEEDEEEEEDDEEEEEEDEEEEEEEGEEDEDVGGKSRIRRNKTRKAKPKTLIEEDESSQEEGEDAEEKEDPKDVKKRGEKMLGKKRKAHPKVVDEDEDENSDEKKEGKKEVVEEKEVLKKKHRKSKQRQLELEEEEEEESEGGPHEDDKKKSEKEEDSSEEEDIDQNSVKRRRRIANTPGLASATSSKKRKNPPPKDLGENDQDVTEAFIKDHTLNKMKEKSKKAKEEEKSENDSPIQKFRKGLSIKTLVDDEDNDNDDEDEEEVKEEDDDGMDEKNASIEVPYVDLRERIRATSNEQELLELLTDIFGELFEQGKQTSNRLFSLALLHVVKEKPQHFDHPSILKYLLRLLRSKHYIQQKQSHMERNKKAGNVKIKDGNEISIAVLVCNILQHLLKDKSEWPTDSIKVFLDDSLYSRVWVDHELTRIFVENIKTFIDPPNENALPLIKQRFHGDKNLEEMKDLVMNHIRTRLQEMEKERMNVVSSGGNTSALRNMILTLKDFSSFPRARALAAENMENWLQNSSVKTPSRDLLTKIISQCNCGSSIDLETVNSLLKMKLKSTMFQLKVETVGQLIRQNEEYLKLALRVFISRERPNNMGKDVDNMKIIQQIFRIVRSSIPSNLNEESFFRTVVPHPGAKASQQLGFVFREFSSTSEVGPVLKTITRKILKQLTFDLVDIKSLCVSILQNEGHWESMKKINNQMLLDHISLFSGVVWLILLMRGAAVKSLQIQHTNVLPGNRQGMGTSSGLSGGSVGLKKSGAQALPRRSLGQTYHRKLGFLNKTKLIKGSGSSLGASNQLAYTDTSGSSRSLVNVSISIKAKEELAQTLAEVQMQSIVCFRQLAEFLDLNGVSSYERHLLDILVKKLLFLEIPADVQPTEHDKTCFASTKEEIPIHEDFLEGILQIYVRCEGIDRLEALRTIETIVFRAADGHLQRESVWASHDHLDDLDVYRQQGGIIGVHVKNESFVDLLWMLVSYKSKESKVDKPLCYSSHFWIITSILLIVASFNPSSVGSYLWRKIPTVRSMMQMLITGRFKFPAIQNFHDTVLTGRTESSLDLVQTNARMREYEQMALSAIPGFIREDPFMILDVENIAREPPPHIIDHLKLLDKKFKLGLRLRQSRDEDFLMEMVAGQEASSTSGTPTDKIWWIAEIVCEEYDTVMYLPPRCICELLVMALTSTQEDQKGREMDEEKHQVIQDTLVRIAPRLLDRLRDYLREYEEEEEQTEEETMSDAAKNASNVILYFLDRLVSSDFLTCRIAAYALQQLTPALSQAPTKSSSVENEPKSSGDADVEIEVVNVEASSPQGMDKTEENHEDEMILPDHTSFDWLFSLAKLRLYRLIDQKVWDCLEIVLEVETSLDSLKLCTKALYELWKLQSNTLDVGTNVFFLGGMYGSFLSNRSFLARLILQDITIWQIFVEVFWTCIDTQMTGSNGGTNMIKNGECKVFYVLDKKKNICEIKLPIPIIHGAAQVVCFSSSLSVSDIQQKKETIPITWTFFDHLKESLFPIPFFQPRKNSPHSGNKKNIIDNITSRSVGLIATKDNQLCSEKFLEQLVLSCFNNQIVEMAARTLPLGNIVNLLSQFGVKQPCFTILCEIIKENIEKNPDQVHQLFQPIAKTEETNVKTPSTDHSKHKRKLTTHHALLSWIQMYREEFNLNEKTTKTNDDTSLFVEKWLQNVVNDQLQTESKPIIDDGLFKPSCFLTFALRKKKKKKTEKQLENRYITTTSTSSSSSSSSSSCTFFFTANGVNKEDTIKTPLIFTKNKLYDVKHINETIIKGKLQNDIDWMECLASYKTDLVSFDSKISPTARKATQTVLLDHLPCLISHSPDKSSKVAFLLMEIFSQSCITSTSSTSTTTTTPTTTTTTTTTIVGKFPSSKQSFCRNFLVQFFSRVDGFFSFESTVSFVSSLLQWDGFKKIVPMANETELNYRQEMVTLLLEFIKERVLYWQKQTCCLFFSSAFDFRNLVLLIKLHQLYTRAMINIALKCTTTTTTTTTTTINKNSIKEQKEFRKSMDLLVAVTRKQQDQHQEDSIVNVLDALVDSFPMHLVVKINTQRYHWESIHQEIQTDFLKVLYFQSPKTVLCYLQGLVPHWEDLLLHTSSSICDAVLSESLDHHIVSIIDSTLEAVIALNTNASSVIDKALNDDKNRSNDGVLFSTDMREKLRSLIVQHPLIVLNRLPVQFGRMIGKVSITQLYLQANFYNNVLDVVQMVRLNGNESTRVFCDCIARILFEILEVIVTHQAIEFTSLVEKILDVFLLYLQVDDELIFEKKCLQHPRWKILFENLHSLFQDQKKKIFQALNILMGKKISDDLKKKKESKKLSVVVNDERFLYLEQRNFQMDALDLHRVERAIDFFQEKIQKKNNIGIFHSQPWSIQVEFVLPFLKLLVDPKMSKALLKRLFEILVQIVRTEETSNVTEMILLEYAKVLRFFRKSQVIEHESTPSMTFYTNFTPKTVGTVNLSLKETIVSYANDFLGCCRNGMTRQWILHELFMDQSDFSKLKLLSYFKSSIVKNIPSFGTVIHEKSP